MKGEGRRGQEGSSTSLSSSSFNKIKLPNRPLTNIDIEKLKLKIPHFRGVFSRDKLPKKIRKTESGVINLDADRGPGTHWVAYKKIGDVVNYFDSYGDLPPPSEAVKYFMSGDPVHILYNHQRYQQFTDYNCGHLCIQFLIN